MRPSLSSLAALFLLVAACGPSDPPSTSNQNQNQNQPNQTNGVSLAITSPAADSFQNRTRIRVQGTATGTSEVLVNGQTTPVSGGVFERLVDFDDGPATATVTAGDVETSVDFFVDTRKPSLELFNPDRGTALDTSHGPILTIEGEASDDGSGLLAIFLDGDVIDDDDGAFAVEYPLQEGLNVFQVTARDRANNERTEYRALIYGPLEDPNTPVDEALTMDVTPGGVDDLADVIEAYATPEQVLALVGDGFEDLTVEELHWDDLDISITPRNGYLELSMTIEGFLTHATYIIADTPVEGYILIETMSVSMDVELGVADDGTLDVTVLDSEVSIDPDDIETDFMDDMGLVQTLIAGLIIYAFDAFVVTLLEDNLFDPDVLTREFEFLDRSIAITFLLDEIIITTDGIRVVLNLEFPGDLHPSVTDLAGALNRPIGPETGASMSRPFQLHTNQTALGRILHSVWRAGLFHQTIGGDDLDGIALPFDLSADGLASLLDQRIRDIHSPDTPVELRLRPLLPPVVEFGGTPGDDELRLELGDFLIDFFLRPDTGESTHILSIALYLDIDVEPQFEDFEISFDIDVTADADIAEEPLFTFDRDRTVDLIVGLVNLVPLLVGNELVIDGDANFEWASLSDFLVEVNGSDRDRLTAGFFLEPAQDFIDDDEVE